MNDRHAPGGGAAGTGGGRSELILSGVHKAFGELPVLQGVDLAVPAGSLTAILGPSGSGKTTLLRVIAGFEYADRGTVELGGVVVDGPGHHVPSRQRRIGYVPQEGSLFPHLTVEGNVGFGLDRSARRGTRIGELLEMVGLGRMGRRYPHQLSGGQQQRVALARALAVEPRIVLLDEPFSSLDATLRASVRADVHDVLRRAGTTAILVTHDQDEALSLADHVAVIRDGRIGQAGTPEALYVRPTDPELARFFGEINLVEGRLRGGVVETALGSLPVEGAGPAASTVGPAASTAAPADPVAPVAGQAADGPVVVMVRPEQIELTRGPGAAGLGGEVTSFEYYGHDAVLRVRPDLALLEREVIVRVTGGGVWAVGTRVGLTAHGPVLAWPAPAAGVTPATRGTGVTSA